MSDCKEYVLQQILPGKNILFYSVRHWQICQQHLFPQESMDEKVSGSVNQSLAGFRKDFLSQKFCTNYLSEEIRN